MSRTTLGSRRPPQYVLAIRIESMVPEPNTLHQALGILQLPISSENRIHKLAPTVLPHLHCPLAAFPLRSPPHELLAHLEELLEATPKPVATHDEIVHHVLVIRGSDSREALLGSLHLAGELDEQQPEVARDFGHRGGGPIAVDGPVVDPFAERIGVEHTTEE